MALTPAERKRRQREREKELDVQTYRMELTGTERWCIQKAAARQGYEDQTEYLLSLVYADLKKPASRACNYPECNCPFDKPSGAECYRGHEEKVKMNKHEYSQGVCADGAAILKDGQPMTIEEILAALRSSDHIPDATKMVQGDVQCMGNLYFNDEDNYENALVITFADRAGLKAALDSKQCRFTVFGGEA